MSKQWNPFQLCLTSTVQVNLQHATRASIAEAFQWAGTRFEPPVEGLRVPRNVTFFVRIPVADGPSTVEELSLEDKEGLKRMKKEAEKDQTTYQIFWRKQIKCFPLGGGVQNVGSKYSTTIEYSSDQAWPEIFLGDLGQAIASDLDKCNQGDRRVRKPPAAYQETSTRLLCKNDGSTDAMEEKKFITENISQIFFCPLNMNYSDMNMGVVKDYISFPWGNNPALDSNSYFDEITKSQHSLQDEFDEAVAKFIESAGEQERWRRHINVGYDWLYTRQALFQPRRQYLETERRFLYDIIVSTAALISHRFISMEQQLWPTSMRTYPPNIMGHGPTDYASMAKVVMRVLQGPEFPDQASRAATLGGPSPSAAKSSGGSSSASAVTEDTAQAVVSSEESRLASDVHVLSLNVKDEKTEEEDDDEINVSDVEEGSVSTSEEAHFAAGDANVLQEIKDPSSNKRVMNSGLAQLIGISCDSMCCADAGEEVAQGVKAGADASTAEGSGETTGKRKRSETTAGHAPRITDHCYSVLTTAQRNYFFALSVRPGDVKPELIYYGEQNLHFFPFLSRKDETTRSSGAERDDKSQLYKRVEKAEFEKVVAAHVLMYTDALKAVKKREATQTMDEV